MVLHLRCFAVLLVLNFAFAAFASGDFRKKNILVANRAITVEIAETPDQHKKGLMFREVLSEDEGMLFVFNNEETRYFWMKNTFIDLSVGFFNKEKILIDIQEMKSGTRSNESVLPSYASAQPAMYALEMKKGWFDRNQIKIGSKIKIH